MDLLWGESSFTDADLSTLGFGTRDEVTVFHTKENEEVITQKLKGDAQWDKWFGSTNVFDTCSDERQLVIACTPRKPQRPGRIRNPMALQYFPFDSRDVFKEFASKMHLHRAMTTLLTHGWSAFSRLAFSDAALGDGVSYNLRTQHTWPNDCLLSISYFPAKKKTFVLFHGLSPGEVDLIRHRLDAASQAAGSRPKYSRAAVFSPFTYLALFLYLERKGRFAVVESQATKMQMRVQNFGNVPAGDQSREDASSVGSARSHDPDNMVGLFLDLGHLKTGLQGWRDQVKSMMLYGDEFDRMHVCEGAATLDRNRIDPKEYLLRMVNDYELMITKCEMVMEGTSLAYQMEMSHWTRLDQDITIRDGKQMKAIALLTMVFLPATFVATFMSVPIVNWEPPEGDITSPLFYVFFAVSVPLTLVVVAAYFWWIGCFSRRKKGVRYTSLV